jgi:hypothetical protein
MNKDSKQSIKYSFIMAPFYLIDNDDLLKAQLLNLNMQTDTNFEVVIPDPHYKKRSWLKDFCKDMKYKVKHFKHSSHSIVPRTFDYGIFNDAVLMSEGEKIITYQDWRFCHHKLIETLNEFEDFDYIGFKWQVSYLHSSESTSHLLSFMQKHHPNNIIDFSPEDSENMFKKGIFTDIKMNINIFDRFSCGTWGHYCIKRNLWLDVNGIDEVVTNTRHYGDLDFDIRLQNFYRLKNLKIEIPVIENAMVRIMHLKGNYFAGANVELDDLVNQDHKSCCFSKNSNINNLNMDFANDQDFTLYVVDKINKGEFSKLYSFPYLDSFVQNNKISKSCQDGRNKLDDEYSIIGFQCKKCNVVGETPYWYEKNSELRVEAMKNIGKYPYVIGRDLKKIDSFMNGKSFLEKIDILNSGIYN